MRPQPPDLPDSMFNQAAQLMLEAWYWMPAALVFDLIIYHLWIRKVAG